MNLNDFEDETDEDDVKPKSILEQIGDMKTRKEGKDWGYKEDPRPNRKKHIFEG